MKLLLVGLCAGCLLLYVAYAGFVGGRYLQLQNDQTRKTLALAALGKKVASELSMQVTQPLGLACAGKLEPGNVGSLVGYTVKASDDIGGSLHGIARQPTTDEQHDSHWRTDRIIVEGMYNRERTFGSELMGALDPMTWKYKKTGYVPFVADVREARYLAVTRASTLTMPDNQGDTYLPGTAELVTRVVSVPDGKTVCEGLSHATKRGTVEFTGKGKTKADAHVEAVKRVDFHVRAYFASAVHYRPLAEVCEVGGKLYCDKVRAEAGDR